VKKERSGPTLTSAVLGVFVLGACAGGVAAQSAEVKLIVNAANPGGAITRKDVADIFMKRATRWSFGAPAEPVDQSLASPVRAAFCRQVLNEVLPAIQKYWQQQISSGRSTPPPVKAGDEEVIAFVSVAPGAVGYVSASTALPDTVKVLRVEDAN
jgi:ABC-type phosphate transport system substrate-binding protein